jgi:hypothetical protein
MTARKILVRSAIGILALLALIQLVPYGHAHGNPPVTRAPRWDSPGTAKLVADACGDCHTNLTNWRWYSNIAPASWLVQNDVDGGRRRLNFSRWDAPQPDVNQVIDQIASGNMPPWQYTPVHPASQLSKAQKAALMAGLRKTYANDPPPLRRRGD